MSEVVVFINYLSAFEEKSYHADAVLLAPFLREAASSDDVIATYKEIVERRVGVNLFDELANPSLIAQSMPAREVQYYLNLAIFRIIETQIPIRAVAGYSAGYWQTFVASGAYEVEYFDRAVRPIVMAIRSENLEFWNKGTLASVFLYHPGNDRFNAEVKGWISDSNLKSFVFVKDDRPPFALQIAGHREGVEQIWAMANRYFPEVAGYSSKVRQCDSAHLPVKPHADAHLALSRSELSIPKYPIVGSDGFLLTKENWTTETAALVLYTGVYEPLNMSLGAGGIRRLDLPVIAIGSERVTRFSFHGLAQHIRPLSISIFRFSDSSGIFLERLTFGDTPGW
jgi:hypothetical protein